MDRRRTNNGARRFNPLWAGALTTSTYGRLGRTRRSRDLLRIDMTTCPGIVDALHENDCSEHARLAAEKRNPLAPGSALAVSHGTAVSPSCKDP